VIVAVEVIEHLYSPQRFFENARRHLRPAGHLIVTTPYHGYLKNLAIGIAGGWDRHLGVHWEGGHIKFFSVNSLRSMLEGAGFRTPEFRFAGRAPLLWRSMACRVTR
jgi:2-polyprenyl-3-methyl-5-hydroxy-6-metoxy-1,4-benzoquinol methylase